MDNIENMNNKTDNPVIESITAENTSAVLDFLNSYARERAIPDMSMKNLLKQTGKAFKIFREDDEPIIISSSEEIDIEIDYSPRALSLFIKCNNTVNSTELSITGFKEALHKYEDHYSNYEKLLPNSDGKIIFKQDISKNHFLCLQLKESTYILTEAGWTPSNVGTWNPKTRQATLLVEGNQTIEIQTDDVILNGLQPDNSKYTIDGNINSLAIGIFINGRSKIAICNFEIKNCSIGIRVLNSEDILIKKNAFFNFINYGVSLDSNTDVKIKNNYFKDGYIGILINYLNDNVCVEENDVIPTQYGVYASNYNMNIKILKNSIIKNNMLTSFTGLTFNSLNSHIKIENNLINVSDSKYPISSYLSLYGIYSTTNNDTTIMNNKILISNNRVDAILNNSIYNYFYGIYINAFTSDKTIIKSNEINIENNTLTTQNSYMSSIIYGIYTPNNYSGHTEFQCNKLSIKNNIFSSSQNNPNSINATIKGLYCTNCYNGISIINNSFKVSNNTLATPGPSPSFTVYGLHLYYVLSGVFKNNLIKISNNSLSSSAVLYALYLDYYFTNNSICSNDIKLQSNEGRLFYSIFIYRYANRNELKNNIICDNQGTAIYSQGYNDENTIQGNTITNNKENGILLNYYDRYNKILNNTISGNGQNGILLSSQSSKNTIDFNNIINNSTGLFIAAESNSNHINFNNFINKAGQNAFNYGSRNEFCSNYWSDWNGVIPYNVNGVIDYKPLIQPINICEKPDDECKTDSWI